SFSRDWSSDVCSSDLKAIGQSIGDVLLGAVPALGATMPLVQSSWAATIGLVLAVSLITYLTIVFGELLPKRLALLAPERVASVKIGRAAGRERGAATS